MTTKSVKKFSINPAGVWAWDDHSCGLIYRHSVAESARAADARAQGVVEALAALGPPPEAEAGEEAAAKAGRRRSGPVLRLPAALQICFKGDVDVVDQMQFRRSYMRRLAPGEPDIITLRDIKDVVLFISSPRPPPEFMDLFHTKIADRFLRALILYFRIYLQVQKGLRSARCTVWGSSILVIRRHRPEQAYSELRSKREALAKKLALPVVGMVERMRQDLSDARALVGRDYACLMLDRAGCWLRKGLISRETDTRDLRIAESLIRVSARVVWVCLGRRSLGLIERETNRLFRSDAFNIAERRQRRRFEPTPIDDPPPEGCKLHNCSPAVLELLRPRDDYRTLALGVVDWHPRDGRLTTLEKLVMRPEEEVEGLLGLLGRPREDYDDMLRPLSPTKLTIESTLGSLTETCLPGSRDLRRISHRTSRMRDRGSVTGSASARLTGSASARLAASASSRLAASASSRLAGSASGQRPQAEPDQ